MKYLLFVCEGLSDEALEDLAGRTPLEAAKTPVMDELARGGRVGHVSFVPANLEPLAAVANLSLLGYDPAEFYTGLAPLEAPGFGIEQDDRDVIFRSDLVTLLDDEVMDPSASAISEREAGILMKDLSAKFSDAKFKFRRGLGHKNYLVVRDEALLEDLDELDCVPPSYCMGQKISKHMPKGKAGDLIIGLTKKAGAYLENHEIDRKSVV